MAKEEVPGDDGRGDARAGGVVSKTVDKALGVLVPGVMWDGIGSAGAGVAGRFGGGGMVAT